MNQKLARIAGMTATFRIQDDRENVARWLQSHGFAFDETVSQLKAAFVGLPKKVEKGSFYLHVEVDERTRSQEKSLPDVRWALHWREAPLTRPPQAVVELSDRAEGLESIARWNQDWLWPADLSVDAVFAFDFGGPLPERLKRKFAASWKVGTTAQAVPLTSAWELTPPVEGIISVDATRMGEKHFVGVYGKLTCSLLDLALSPMESRAKRVLQAVFGEDTLASR